MSNSENDILQDIFTVQTKSTTWSSFILIYKIKNGDCLVSPKKPSQTDKEVNQIGLQRDLHPFHLDNEEDEMSFHTDPGDPSQLRLEMSMQNWNDLIET